MVRTLKKGFFDKLSAKLGELKEGFFFLTGMMDNNTAELVLTADGNISNIVFVEELVNASPSLPNWKFTALKPALDIKDVSIKMNGYEFNKENLSFYAIEHSNYPDEVDIVIVHSDYNEVDKTTIVNGTFIFLDNFLGELNSVTTIDNAVVVSKDQAEKELIPIAKLKDYLIWREAEFVEKYNGIRHNTENDIYSSGEAKTSNGRPLIAIRNDTLLEWDSKASHPWVLKAKIKYDGDKNNGLPDETTYQLLDELEDQVSEMLKDADGYLYFGRLTADNEREVYFACKDFRKPSKVMHEVSKIYLDKFGVEYEIYKDKYWQTFERF